MKTIAVMQPTYIPWMGYLDLIDQADLFVLLDTVSVAKQSWQTRNRVLSRSGDVVWLPIPTNARMGMPLNEVRIVDDGRWQRKHRRTMESLGPHLADEFLSGYQGGNRYRRLVEFTSTALEVLCGILGVTTRIVWASDLGLPDSLDADERVAAIFDAFAATELLNTQGSRDYGLPQRWHQYEPAPYPQNGGEFISHMSVVDCLARHGPEETLEVVRSGRYAAEVV